MLRIPVDSTDAREQRELEAERVEAEASDARDHAERCRGGFLGEDAAGRPIACTRCRPHLLNVPCWTCGTAYDACNHQRAARRGRCCDGCNHSRRTPPDAGTKVTGGVSAAEATESDDGRTNSTAPVAEYFTRAGVLPVDPVPTDIGRMPERLLIVHDPQLPDSAVVRWRIPFNSTGWIWRCSACQIRTRTPTCAHTFAAALTLAEHLLGLTDPIPAHLTDQELT